MERSHKQALSIPHTHQATMAYYVIETLSGILSSVRCTEQK